MHPTLQALLGLQEIDRDIFKVESELERLPKELAKRREELDNERALLESQRLAHAELQSQIKEIEHTTTGLRQRLRKLEHESNSTKIDASLLASYQHEMRNIKRTISQAEDEGLRTLTEASEIETKASAKDAALAEAEETFAEFSANVEKESAEARARLEVLMGKRSKLSSDGVPADQLETYRRLLKTREGEALAELTGGICQGCFVNIPKNVVVRLARGTELVQCNSCDRILYSYG